MRRKRPKFCRVIVKAKYPERPLNEHERLAVAMGFLQCSFRDHTEQFWCDESKRLTGPEFGRVWTRAGAWCDQQAVEHPGFIGLPEEEYSDTPFLTGQVI